MMQPNTVLWYDAAAFVLFSGLSLLVIFFRAFSFRLSALPKSLPGLKKNQYGFKDFNFF
jgi:hypothetical protein